MSEQKETGLKITMNKPLVEHIYTADPSAHVFNGRIYIYPSHDQDIDFPSDDEGNQYQMKDYHVLSMGIGDTEVTDHGVVLSLEDIPWASKQLWAPDAAFKNGKYYFYFPARDKEGIFRIGVAVGDRPEGPFIPQESFIPGSYSIDPAVFVDDDGRAYMYFGGLWGGQLQNWQTGTFDKTAQPPAGDELALGVVVAELSDDMLTFKAPASESKILDDTGGLIVLKKKGNAFSKVLGCTNTMAFIIFPILRERHTIWCTPHLKARWGRSHTVAVFSSRCWVGLRIILLLSLKASGICSIMMHRFPVA